MYVDPGAGSLILQVLLAGLIATAAAVRSARETVKRFVRKMVGRKTP